MAGTALTVQTGARTEGGRLPFGFLAYLGAAISLVFCYFDLFADIAADVFNVEVLSINPHLQAVLMWLFVVVAVVGLALDRKAHGHKLPLLLGLLALGMVVGTLYTYYDVIILMTGYVILLIAAFVNQNIMLQFLNRAVRSQAAELADLNSSLERRVAAQVEEIDRLARLRRFLAPEVADLITSEGKESLLESHRRYIACLFCDIRDFTPLSEDLEPEEVMDLLQSFHERVGRLVIEHGGTIGYRAGDGLMVFFNDPLPCEAPVLEALRLASDIRNAFAEIRQGWEKLGYDLDIGIGIASGYATLGKIGTEGRIDYTAIGQVVNVASRLCDLSDHGRILMNRRAFLDVEDVVRAEAIGAFELKGIAKQTEIYRLVEIEGAGRVRGPAEADAVGQGG
jgi:class 3 adenylate cyclase